MNNKSSNLVKEFLIKNKLHKKEFAQMIGVTLSYVYNLVDETRPFTTRITTIERIATIMEISPSEFREYIQLPPSERTQQTPELKAIKENIKIYCSSTLEFIRKFDRRQQLEIVDILRGVKPLYIDYAKFVELAKHCFFSYEKTFRLWKSVFKEHLKQNGFNFEREDNIELFDAMVNTAYVNMHP